MARFKRAAGKTSAPTAKSARASGAASGTRPSVASLLNLQQSAGNAATGRLIGGMLVQTKLQTGSSEALPGETPEPAAPAPDAPVDAPPTPQPEETQAAAGSPAALVVDDSVEALGPGQMRKRDYLAQLRVAVGAAADAALGGTEHAGRSGQVIDAWLGSYESKAVSEVNRDLQRLSTDGPAPATAEESIALIAERARTTAATWARTGEVPDLPSGLPGLDALGTGGLLGRVFFKARAGGPRAAGEPRAVQQELGAGRPLDGAVRTRMERALGRSFSNVRVHSDGDAAAMASRLNAKAFTVGEHVAFGAREYRPGTVVGDALLAHELAHVVQQGDAAIEDQRPALDAGGALEADADRSALGAVAALWGGSKSTPRLRVPVAGRSRMRLQRCAGCGNKAAAPAHPRAPTAAADCAVPEPKVWTQEVEGASKLQGAARVDAMATLLRQALCSTGRQVAVAGKRHPDSVHPDDYQKVPVVNFDVALNTKKAWADDRTLSINVGYSFHRGADKYVVLGPKSVNATSPTYSRMYMEHEVFHTEHHLAGAGEQLSADDQELETWTVDFTKYFHQLRSFRMQWSPLIGYYEKATEAARARALDRLLAYYNTPPVPEPERASIQKSFGAWLRRQLKSEEHGTSRLIQDLESRLHVAGAQGAQP